MRVNTFGRLFRFHIFGESHGQGVGIVVDGVPPGTPVDMDRIQVDLDRRRPGQNRFASKRNEPDRLEILSGVHNERATGAPLTFWITNTDAKSKHYEKIRAVPRPGHADWTGFVRYEGHNDPRGGGHFSGRLTAALVAAGALGKIILERWGITVGAHLQQVADVVGPVNAFSVAEMRKSASTNPMKTAHLALVQSMEEAVDDARKARDSLGGVIEFAAEGMPVGVGEPWVDSMESHLSRLLFAIPAVKGVSFGAGCDSVTMRGSEHNDPYGHGDDGSVQPLTNHAGGILGGLSTGAPVWGHVAVKPTSSVFLPQQSVNLETGEEEVLSIEGRHDPIIAIRAVPVVECAMAFGLTDLLLRWRAYKGS